LEVLGRVAPVVDPETSQQDMPTRRFWTGRRIFVVVDDITSWQTAESPLSWPGFVIVCQRRRTIRCRSRARERT
jgi:hypothetical protein